MGWNEANGGVGGRGALPRALTCPSLAACDLQRSLEPWFQAFILLTKRWVSHPFVFELLERDRLRSNASHLAAPTFRRRKTKLSLRPEHKVPNGAEDGG